MFFFKFPREVGLPRKVVFNENQFMRYVNMNNGKRNVYVSVYPFTSTREVNGGFKPVEDSQVIDKLYFDLDSESGFEDIHRFHEFCDSFKPRPLAHCIACSSDGRFHGYVLVKETFLANKKDAVGNSQRSIIKKTGIDADEHIIGDIARVTRMFNTYNLKRRNFCIPLTRKQFEDSSRSDLKVLIQKQNFETDIIMNEERFNIASFDKKRDNGFITWNSEIDFSEIPDSLPIRFDDLPRCIQYILLKEHPIWRERGFVILYTRDKGLLPQETAALLKEFLSPRDFHHSVTDPRGDRQVHYLYSRHDLLFPSCETLKKYGCCPGKCSLYGKAVYR